MTLSRAKSAAIVSSLALAAGMTLAAPHAALAQAATAAPAAQTISSIEVVGNERISRETVLLYLPIQVGDTVDQARLAAGLQALARTELFAAEGTRLSITGGVLRVEVDENPIINQVIFDGNSALSTDKLRDEITVRARSTLTTAKVQQDVARMVELYRQSGRISATVTPTIVELPQKRVDLYFEISEGGKSRVIDINFLGNSRFSDGDLEDVVATKTSSLLRFLSSSDSYDPDRLEYDREQLRTFYRNRGYYDFRVVSAVAELAAARDAFAITYTLSEGERFRFGRVNVSTQLQRLDGNVLLPLVPIRSGELFQDRSIEGAIDALTFAAGSAGFAFVEIRPRFTPNRENNTVDVTFEVVEGPRVYIGRIDIAGNTRTRDDVIRRAIEVAEGDAYNRVLVDRSTAALRALNFFSNVEVEETPSELPDRTSLTYRVEEQPTGELSVSAGYSSYDQLTLELGIAERNFRGRGQQVSANISTGEIRKEFSASFSEPRFMGRDLQAGFNIYKYSYDYSDLAFRSGSTGGNVQIGFRLTRDARLTTRYTLRQDDVSVDQAGCTAGTVSLVLCQQGGTSYNSMIGYSIRLDRRNDTTNPTAGFLVQLDQDLAGLGGDVSYVKTVVQGSYHYDLGRGFVLTTKGEAGYIDGWNGDRVRINDRFFRGGQEFRGFENAGVGPRDITLGGNEALGAKLYAQGTFETTVPTFLPPQWGVRPSLFLDFGTAGLLDKADKQLVPGVTAPGVRDDLGLRAATGLSIGWRSPIGPIRVDFSHILKKEAYDETKAFQFTTLRRF